MKIESGDVENINGIISACAIGGVESIIIEDGTVRGVDEARTFVIISDVGVPKLSHKIGLTRLSALKQRLDLFKNPAIDAKETDRGEISSLEITSGKNNVQFRCTSTSLIKAPKSVNDTDAFSISITKDELKLLSNSIKAMSSKTIQLIAKRDGVISFVISDSNNDAVTITLDQVYETTRDTDVFYYHADTFGAVIRDFISSEVAMGAFVVGESGTLKTVTRGHIVYLLPKIGED